MPARVDRVEIRDGEVLYRDLTAPREPEIWVHGIELAVENVTTRPKLADGRPVTVTGRAKLGRSGDVTLFASADPFASQLAFAGGFGVKGWKVAELFDLIQPATKVQTPQGTLDMFAEFKAAAGEISGGVKPVLKNVKVAPTEDNLGNKLKAWVADEGLRLFSDRVPERNAVATVIPIKGRLDDPDVQLWPTVLGVVRNAFVEGISSGFTHLPPPTADKPQGKVEQVKEGLEEGRGAAEGTADRRGREADREGPRREGRPAMRRLGLIVAFALVVAGGCAHTKTTDEGRPEKEDKNAKPAGAETQKPHAGAGRAQVDASRGRRGGADQSVPLATAPGGLLAPGAEEEIREQLAAEGCLDDDAKRSGGALSEGLSRCQSAHDLPATGMPDDATIKALGLDPDQIFRHGPVKD